MAQQTSVQNVGTSWFTLIPEGSVYRLPADTSDGQQLDIGR